MVKRIEGLLLGLYALILFYLMLTGRFKLYINPKFMWMTFLSASVLLVYAVHGILNPPQGFRKLHVIVILALIVLMLTVPAREFGAEDLLFSPF